MEEINLSRQKQNNRFYLFNKSWEFSVKHVMYRYKSAKSKHYRGMIFFPLSISVLAFILIVIKGCESILAFFKYYNLLNIRGIQTWRF